MKHLSLILLSLCFSAFAMQAQSVAEWLQTARAAFENGEIVRREWLKTAEFRPNVVLHNFVVMPNHFHGIFEITGNTDNNYVLKNDDTTHDVGAGRALPLRTTIY